MVVSRVNRQCALLVTLFLIVAASGPAISFSEALADDLCPPDLGWSRLTPLPDVRPAYRGQMGNKFNDRVLAIAPGPEPSSIYAGGFEGLYRSDDCGRTWNLNATLSASPNFFGAGATASSVASLPNGVILVGRDFGGVAISRDHGLTWDELFIGESRLAPSRAGSVEVTQDGRLYVRANVDGNQNRLVFAWSNDGAETWNAFWARGFELEIPPLFTADPVEFNVLYRLGPFGRGLERSLDGGASFQAWAARPFSEVVQSLRLSSDGSRFWAVVGGRTLVVSRDRGRTWSYVATAPADLRPLTIGAVPALSQAVFVADEDGYVWMYRE